MKINETLTFLLNEETQTPKANVTCSLSSAVPSSNFLDISVQCKVTQEPRK